MKDLRYWGLRLLLRKVLAFSSIFLLSGVAYAGKIPEPPPIKDLETRKYLRLLYDNYNNLQILTATPNGTRIGNVGDIIVFNDAGTYKIFVNTDGNKSWSQM